MLLFLSLFAWRATTTGLGLLAILFLCLFFFFAFYALNYRTLIICLTRESLTLAYGIFTWTTPLEHIAECSPDPVSLWRIGGAGIHFTCIRRRYRAMFNGLEYPRVVVALKKRRGPVWDIVFSTQRPDHVMSTMMEALAQQNTALHSPDRPDPVSAAADGRAEPG
jgi:hypothetical protein